MNDQLKSLIPFYNSLFEDKNRNYYFIYVSIAISRSLIVTCSNLLIICFIKEKKVTIFNKMKNLFCIISVLYIVMIAVEKYFLFLTS